MALLSQAEVEARLQRSLSAKEATLFVAAQAAAQAAIEQKLNVSVESTTATSRYYDGGVQHLSIDLCTDITSVEYVDDDDNSTLTLDTSDYTLEPRNKTLKSMLRHRVKTATGINNVKVTAKFSTYGDTEATTIVKNAMLDMVVETLVNTGNVKKESLEGYSVEYRDFKDTPNIIALNNLVRSIL